MFGKSNAGRSSGEWTSGYDLTGVTLAIVWVVRLRIQLPCAIFCGSLIVTSRETVGWIGR